MDRGKLLLNFQTGFGEAALFIGFIGLTPELRDFLQLFGVKEVPDIQNNEIALLLAHHPLDVLRPDAA
jgi:hypothetical protein